MLSGTNLMRALTAISLLSAIGLLGCANRGMKPPGPDGGPGAGGTVATGGRGGQGGQGGMSGRGGGAGTTATGGSGGTGGQPTGTAGNCLVMATDGGIDGGPDGGACAAMFSFESGIQGAIINSGSTAFTAVRPSGTFTYCGSGALAINALFSGGSGPTTKGEVLLNLPGAPVDLTNKTITVRVAADPGCSSDLYLSVVLNTQAGAYYFSPLLQVRTITNQWKVATGTVIADAGTNAALALSLQAFSGTGYVGTIYVDEIDIR
jgi:hypothetical protein